MRYNIFVSHSWNYDAGYNKIIEWLDAEKESNPLFAYANYSVPREDPFDKGSKAKLQTALTGQIAPANVVVIIGGMYATYSDWINYEVNEAVRMQKKVLLVEPWGQQKVPAYVRSVATKTVGWNSASVIKGITTL